MKNIMIILMCLISTAALAQNGFGIKGGLNYGDNGEITYSDVSQAGKDVIEGGESKTGYHFGMFYQINVLGFFLRPELVYTTTKSEYSYNDEVAEYNLSKLDLPVLVGTGVFGPLQVFAGPSFQYILDNDFEGARLEDVDQEITVGAQLGAGVQIGKLGLEVRYERSLKENEATVLNNETGLSRVDTRPSQIIFSLLLDL